MQKKTNLIWDLSGTLFKPSHQGLTQEELADYSFVFLMWAGKKDRSRLDEIAFKVLSLLGEQPTNSSQEIIRVHTGAPLPKIVCDYLAGNIHSAEALTTTLAFFDAWAPQHLCPEDEQQVRRMLETFFNPRALVTCMKPIKKMVELMMRSAQKNTHYILSNWDRDSFSPFYSAYKDTELAHFTRDQIVISADTGFVKPQRGIYEWILSHKHLDPSSCFFIDDQEENVKAATSVGINAFQVKLQDLEPLTETLKERGLL